jgi:hypothetical protein
MINVGIISEKESVAFHMASVVCKAGAHAERFDGYVFDNIKKFNIVIIDLDNAQASYENIKKTAAGIKDIIVAGFSRSNELLDEYRPIISVFLKPFKTDHFLTFVADLKQLTKTEQVVNTEETPVYKPTGQHIVQDDLINTEVFSDKEMTQKLAKIINEKYNGPSEDEFLQNIGLSDVVIVKKPEVLIEIKPLVDQIDHSRQFVDDALIKYRAKKLRERKMSTQDVLNKVRELLKADAERSRQSFVNVDTIMKKFDESNEIEKTIESIPIKNSEPIKPIETIGTIEEQRKEAIFTDVERPRQVDPTPLNDNFTEVELKYIKQSPTVKVEQKVEEKPKPKPTTTLPQPAANGIVIDQAAVAKKAQSTMTPEQIERLRKLGVKI